jgi:hypothetical protein
MVWSEFNVFRTETTVNTVTELRIPSQAGITGLIERKIISPQGLFSLKGKVFHNNLL